MEHKSTAIPMWGWWGGSPVYPGGDLATGQASFRDHVQMHLDVEQQGGWELVSSQYISAASDDFMLFIWKRPYKVEDTLRPVPTNEPASSAHW